MEAVRGWYNPVTKEQGKFNKTGAPVRYSFLDKIINWFRKLRWDWAYSAFKQAYYEYKGLIQWKDGTKGALYINPYEKRAYVADGWKRFIDYNAITQDGAVIEVLREELCNPHQKP